MKITSHLHLIVTCKYIQSCWLRTKSVQLLHDQYDKNYCYVSNSVMQSYNLGHKDWKISLYTHFAPPPPLCNVDKTLWSNTSLHFTIFQHWKLNGGAGTYSLGIMVMTLCFCHFPTQFVHGCSYSEKNEKKKSKDVYEKLASLIDKYHPQNHNKYYHFFCIYLQANDCRETSSPVHTSPEKFFSLWKCIKYFLSTHYTEEFENATILLPACTFEG